MPDAPNALLGWVSLVDETAPTTTDITVGLTAGGAVGVFGAATLTVTVDLLAGRGYVGGANRTVTVGLTAAGVVGLLRTTTPTAVGVGLTAAGSVSSTDFVTLDPATGYLMLDGQRFRFAGNNAPNEIGMTAFQVFGGTNNASGQHLATHAHIDDILDQTQDMNGTVIRAFGSISQQQPEAVQPTFGSFSSSNLEPVDYFLQQCNLRGIKVIFPLVDNYDWGTNADGKFWYCTANGVTPDAGATQFYTNSTVIASFKAMITFVLNHVNVYTGIAYRNDPAVLAWETGNEMDTSSDGANATGLPWIYDSWTSEIADHIKHTLGAQQLVQDGHSPLSVINGVTDADILDDPDVDLFTVHVYSEWGDPQELTYQAAIFKARKKAFYIGEFTWTGRGNFIQSNFALPDFGQPAWMYWELFEFLSTVSGNTDFDGDLFWELHSTGSNWGSGINFTVHSPPGGNTQMGLAEETWRNSMLADHALQMQKPLPSPTGVWMVDAAATGSISSRNRGVTFVTTEQRAHHWYPAPGDMIVVVGTGGGTHGGGAPIGVSGAMGTGWVRLGSVSSTTHTLAAAYHIVTGAESSAGTGTYTAVDLFDTSTAGDCIGFVLRGADPNTPLDNIATYVNNTNSVNGAYAGYSGANVSDGSLVVSVASADNAGSGFAWNQPATGWGPINVSTNGLGAMQAAVKETRTETGVTLANTAISTTSWTVRHASLTFAFQPRILVPSLYPPVRRPNYGSLLQV